MAEEQRGAHQEIAPERTLPGAGAVRERAPGPEEVDVSLIRWMLSLSPLERLEVLQNHLRALRSLKDARDSG